MLFINFYLQNICAFWNQRYFHRRRKGRLHYWWIVGRLSHYYSTPFMTQLKMSTYYHQSHPKSSCWENYFARHITKIAISTIIRLQRQYKALHSLRALGQCQSWGCRCWTNSLRKPTNWEYFDCSWVDRLTSIVRSIKNS